MYLDPEPNSFVLIFHNVSPETMVYVFLAPDAEAFLTVFPESTFATVTPEYKKENDADL